MSSGVRYAAVLGVALLMCPWTHSAAHAQRLNGAGMVVSGSRPPDTPPIAGKPLETRPNVVPGQKPAFAGQTRAPAVISATPFDEKVVTRGLNHPWGMAFLPDGKILVTEKPGTIRVIDMVTGNIVGEVKGVPDVLYKGDAGLLDVVLDPAFSTNRLLYISYVEPRAKENGLNVMRAKLSDKNDELQDQKIILTVEPSLPRPVHYGCRMIFGPDGFLYVTVGERFFYPTRGEAQSLYSLLGKVLRITGDGQPAPDNPYVQKEEFQDSTRGEIWSYGHRNPQGLAFQPGTGELWEAEHGPEGGDELNVIKKGSNYGWPIIAYGSNYDKTLIDGSFAEKDGRGKLTEGAHLNANTLTALKGMEQPAYYWDPTIAPSGISFYDGKLVPEWKGNLFVAALAGEHVSRLVLDGHKVVGEERLLLNQHQRIRDVQEGPDGALWVITDDADGRLIRLAAK